MKNRITPLLVFVCILTSITVKAITYTSTGNGDWMTSGRWSPAGPPTSGSHSSNKNIIIIQSGHTITISGEDISLSHVILYIYGTLNMDNSGLDYANLNLTGTGSGVVIQPGGRVIESSLLAGFLNIRVNGVVEWNGSDGNVTAGGTRITLPSSGVDDPLPVILTDWKIEKNQDYIDATWFTSSEKDNDYFTIEESEDGIFFYEIATTASKGNSSITQEYSLSFSPKAKKNILYYRLKQTDLNGDFNYSAILTVNFGISIEVWNVFPNPVSNGEFTILGFSISEISLQDIQSGQEILHQVVSETGTNSIYVSLPSDIHTGLYLLSVTNKDGKVTKPIMVH